MVSGRRSFVKLTMGALGFQFVRTRSTFAGESPGVLESPGAPDVPPGNPPVSPSIPAPPMTVASPSVTPPTPRFGVAVHHRLGGQSITAITRVWSPGDTERCRLCPAGECSAHEGVCQVLADRFIPFEDCLGFVREPAAGAVL